jgi:hypothetical protein
MREAGSVGNRYGFLAFVTDHLLTDASVADRIRGAGRQQQQGKTQKRYTHEFNSAMIKSGTTVPQGCRRLLWSGSVPLSVLQQVA